MYAITDEEATPGISGSEEGMRRSRGQTLDKVTKDTKGNAEIGYEKLKEHIIQTRCVVMHEYNFYSPIVMLLWLHRTTATLKLTLLFVIKRERKNVFALLTSLLISIALF